jgi:SAM-dependent methyltransferase
MPALSKICDAADWFNPEMLTVIQNELQENPRFHRKQWEFAMIFLALKKYGFLRPDALGLSLGGGKERVLYAIARHIQHLTVTDLYELDTTWDCAKTADPDEFIKSHKPFEVEDSRLKALRMDMRELEFEDDSFDFCYSSCAIEHIGDYADFLRHLNEVQRVLKEGGIYVFTTEFHFGNETIQDSHNYIFSPQYLCDLIAASKLAPAEQPQLTLTPHRINHPLPGNIKNLCFSGPHQLLDRLFEEYPHLSLLRGKYPFTSILLILKKEKETGKQGLVFSGFDKSRAFLQAGLEEYRTWLQTDAFSIHPFSSLPAGISRFYTDHAEFFENPGLHTSTENTLFHSDYFWLGSGEKRFNIGLRVAETSPHLSCCIQLRIHRYFTLNSRTVDVAAEVDIPITAPGWVYREITLPLNDNYCYAVLGKMIDGECRFDRFEVLCSGKNTVAKHDSLPAVTICRRNKNSSPALSYKENGEKKGTYDT